MTKYHLKLISLLIIIIIVGCSKSDKENKSTGYDSSKAYESVEIKDQNISLRYNLEKGDKYSYKLTTITNALESIQADSLIKSNSSQNLQYIFNLEVIEIDEEKVAEIAINISSVKVSANINGQKISFDTKANPSKEEQEKFLEYSAISNSPYRARISPKGEVIEVSRLDKMIDKMISIQSQQQKLSTEERAQLAKNLSNAAVRPLTQLIFRELPEKQIAKDSTWERRYPSQMTVFTLENIAKFKVDDFFEIDGDKAAKISADLSVTYTGNKKGEQEGVKYSFDDPKMSGDGFIIYNIDKGILIKSETTTNVEISVEVLAKDSMQKLRKTKRKENSTNKNIVELI
ncbi:MAG: hypothetical protein FJ214_02210 [Ignavibacteria bacterium]|nr:hypothetical protein [Ignavibacteria bacterium]